MDEETSGTALGGAGIYTLNALTLRRIAEWTSGVRGEVLWFVVDPNPPEKFQEYAGKIHLFEGQPVEGDDYSAQAVVIPAHTPKVNPPGKEVNFGRLGPDKDRYVNLMHVRTPEKCYKADAVFWSESSVEKFVVPYYASVYGHEAVKVIKAILAILHYPPKDEAATWAPGDPFALVHVPTSEYIPGSDASVDEVIALILREFFVARINPSDVRKVELVNLAEVARERQQAGGAPGEEQG